MGTNKHIDNFVKNITSKNYAKADASLRQVVKEKLQARYKKEYNAIKTQFFGK